MERIVKPINTYTPDEMMLRRLRSNQTLSDIREYENGDLQYDVTTDRGNLQLDPLFQAFNAIALPVTAVATTIQNQRQRREEEEEMIRALQSQIVHNPENKGLTDRLPAYAEKGGYYGKKKMNKGGYYKYKETGGYYGEKEEEYYNALKGVFGSESDEEKEFRRLAKTINNAR